MFRISNTLVGYFNVLTLFLSLAGMGGSAYIHFHKTDCLKVLMYPLLFGTIFIFLVSILGITGLLFRVNEALYAYLLASFFVILWFMLFTVFALFVTNNKVVADNKGIHEYDRVEVFSLWLQQYVIKDKNWNDIKTCMVGVGLCQRNLSIGQVGCCKPPVECGFIMKNKTFWEMPKTGPAVNNTDCRTWKNREKMLCYDCNACKGQVLGNIRKQWRYLTMFNVCVLIILTTIYVLGCYAIRNNQIHHQHHHHSYGITRHDIGIH